MSCFEDTLLHPILEAVSHRSGKVRMLVSHQSTMLRKREVLPRSVWSYLPTTSQGKCTNACARHTTANTPHPDPRTIKQSRLLLVIHDTAHCTGLCEPGMVHRICLTVPSTL